MGSESRAPRTKVKTFCIFVFAENDEEKKEQNDSDQKPLIKIEPAEPMETNEIDDKLANQPASKRKKKD